MDNWSTCACPCAAGSLFKRNTPPTVTLQNKLHRIISQNWTKQNITQKAESVASQRKRKSLPRDTDIDVQSELLILLRVLLLFFKFLHSWLAWQHISEPLSWPWCSCLRVETCRDVVDQLVLSAGVRLQWECLWSHLGTVWQSWGGLCWSSGKVKPQTPMRDVNECGLDLLSGVLIVRGTLAQCSINKCRLYKKKLKQIPETSGCWN